MSATSNRSARLAAIRRKCSTGEAKQVRVAANVSISEIAADIGVTPNAVWAWENCRRSPQGDAALLYARALSRLEAQVPA
jgi:DNA-binding transcriptional regulator YiaG